jgi:hypothetical protein
MYILWVYLSEIYGSELKCRFARFVLVACSILVSGTLVGPQVLPVHHDTCCGVLQFKHVPRTSVTSGSFYVLSTSRSIQSTCAFGPKEVRPRTSASDYFYVEVTRQNLFWPDLPGHLVHSGVFTNAYVLQISCRSIPCIVVAF